MAARKAPPPEQLFEAIVSEFTGRPGVSVGTGFGSTPGLRVGGKIFAMLGGERLVVKLPKARVDEMVAAGDGERFDPRRDGRLMKEWVTVSTRLAQQWPQLVEEALHFVSSASGARSTDNR
jgi:hypothetical protein